MAENHSEDSCQEMTKLQNNPTPDNTTIGTVTTAEVSSAETTESPRQQPQAVTMATESPTVSYSSTVHVQQGPSFSLLLTKSASEPLPLNPRKTLVRSQALRSTPSPPPVNEDSEESTSTTVTSASFDYQYQSNDNEIIREAMPRQGSMGHKQGSFSRDNSFEYTDSTGTDLHEFIVKTLKNPRDRKFVLKLEHDFLNFIQDPLIIFIKYPPMTSYYRMIVHRVAAFFGMEHNVDQQTGKSVIINKSITTRIPEHRFAELVSLSREDSEDSEGSMPKSILRRDNLSLDDSTPPKIDSPLLASLSMEDKRQKSFEEREEEYRKVKARIFNQSSQSSQSSHSSKGDGDMPQPQILTREESEEIPTQQTETVPRLLLKSQSFDERTIDKGSVSRSGARVVSNKVLNRSSSSPGGSAAAFAAAERFAKSTSNPKLKRVAGYSVPVSGMQYWTPDGIPVVPVPGNDIPMVQTHSGVPGMVPVMNTSQQGNVMWTLPTENIQQGMMLINPNTGTPALGPDGNPIIVQPSYQPVVMKPGNNPGYTQPPPPQHRQQSSTQVAQSSPVGPAQMVMPYMGMQQPMYVVQQAGRYPQQQGSESLSQVHWSGNPQQMSCASYQDLGNQFSGMSITGQPQDMDPSLQHTMIGGGESAVVASSTTTSSMYVSSMSQGQPGQPGQVQYVMLPPQSMHPQQSIRPMVGQSVPAHMVPPPSMQQGSTLQQNPTYVVTPQTAYSSSYQPQYGYSKDASMVQRPQSPPTPPQTSSPSSFNQQSNTQYQQQPNRSMVPLVVAGSPQVPVGATVLQGNQTGQIPGQPGAMPPYHVVPLPAQYHQPGQNRIYNRPGKSSELYEAGMVVGQPAMGQVAFGQYGEQITMIPSGDRPHYAPFYPPQRFSQPQGVAGSGVPHHQYSKHKSKQYHKKRDSPREQSLKKQTSKSSDSSDAAPGGTGNVLEIYDLSTVIKDQDADGLFEELKSAGAKIKWQGDTHKTFRAVFSCASAADQALAVINSPHYKLRVPVCTSSPVDSTSSVQSNP